MSAVTNLPPLHVLAAVLCIDPDDADELPPMARRVGYLAVAGPGPTAVAAG